MSSLVPSPAPPREGAEIRVDVAVVGGGVAGLTLAALLGGAGMDVACIDRQTPEPDAAARLDGRTSALMRGSVHVVEASGAWAYCREEAEPLWRMRIVDDSGAKRLRPRVAEFDSRELDGGPFGHNIANAALRRALLRRLAELPNVRHLAPAAMADASFGPEAAVVHLADGRSVRAALVAGADGRDSPTREAARIPATSWGYPQRAIVCCVEHERSHDGVSVEYHRPSGPFTLVPMPGRRSGIVWVERAERVPRFMALDDRAFTAELQRRAGNHLGQLRLASERFDYPLGALYAHRIVAPRVALVAEAAHALPPIGAQGLNLSLRDVAALAEVVVDAARLGEDVGRAEVLRPYERRRRLDVASRLAAVDALNRLVANDLGMIRALRGLGLDAIERLGPLKRFLMWQGMRGLADEPRLARGEPL
jgi:2-octaprenyl-6-methoxyphenol hydroxylase